MYYNLHNFFSFFTFYQKFLVENNMARLIMFLYLWSQDIFHISMLTMDHLLFTLMFSFVYHYQDFYRTWLYISNTAGVL
jgi:hypothetical protein